MIMCLCVVKDGKKRKRCARQRLEGGNGCVAESVKAGKEPPIPYEQLMAVTKSTFAAVESIRSGNPVEIK